MNPEIKYTFKSVTGREITISSRTGEDSARMLAMRNLWGWPKNEYDWYQSRGLGLSLIQTEEVQAS